MRGVVGSIRGGMCLADGDCISVGMGSVDKGGVGTSSAMDVSG